MRICQENPTTAPPKKRPRGLIVLRNQPYQLPYRAIRAAARKHPVPPGAQCAVVIGLNIKARVKIGWAAFAPQQRTHALPPHQHEIHPPVRRDGGEAQALQVDTFGALVLLPLDIGALRRWPA